MPGLDDLDTVTITGRVLQPQGEAWEGAYLTFTAPTVVTTEGTRVLGGTTRVDLSSTGMLSVELLAIDADGIDPTGWTYEVNAYLSGVRPTWTRYITLPKATPAVDLGDIIVADPVAGTFTVLKDPRYVGDVLVGGTPAADKVLTATSSTAASWQTPSAGGGTSIRTASVRITDDNLSGLPAAASWTIVQTSAGTQLKAAIAASAGDRVRVCGNFMFIGSHFLDWVLLDNAGAAALYATTGTITAPTEGNPTMYPSRSFGPMPSPDMFTISAGHINAGLITVALAHQGAATGSSNIVYAHGTYPWRLRLENIGPEPA